MHSLFVNVSFGFPGTDSRVYGGNVFLWIFSWQSNSYVPICNVFFIPCTDGCSCVQISQDKSQQTQISSTLEPQAKICKYRYLPRSCKLLEKFPDSLKAL
jgi:hypothetical protein